MKTLRELFNSYATPATEEELALLAKLDRVPPLSDRHTERGKMSEGGSTRGG